MDSNTNSRPLSTVELQPIVRKYVNPDVARSVPELQRSIVAMLTSRDRNLRRTPLQVSRIYGISLSLMTALLVAHYEDQLERPQRKSAGSFALYSRTA